MRITNLQHRRNGRTRRLLSVMTAAALFITSVNIPFCAKTSQAAETTLSNPTTDSDGVTTWDCVYFGNYWQNDTNGDGTADQNDTKEPIKWRVLSVNGNGAFLLADQNLDCQPYNEDYQNVTWETSTLRTWLHDTFMSNAFTSAERAAIYGVTVANDDNPSYDTEGGNDTTDGVSLLSIAEASNTAYGFAGSLDTESKTREAKNTAYAKQRGAATSTETAYDGNGDWWLRSPGGDSDYAAYVIDDGWGDDDGNCVDDSETAVRPVLHIQLSASDCWSYAGTVNSNGETQIPTTLNSPKTDSDGVTTWDCVYFGNYWQNDTNGDGTADQDDTKEPIKWRVLSVTGNDAFLLADQNLDCQPYNEEDESVTWETCTLRTWLNGTFLSNAFTSSEQAAIQSTTVVNDDNPTYGTEGGNNTTDKVYLLSIAEARNTAYGFDGRFNSSSETREAKNTAYAKTCGAETSTNTEYEGNGYWWLRSPGGNRFDAAHVYDDGWGYLYGDYVYYSIYVVRPALHVNLSRLNLSSSTLWRYAGQVSSDGTVSLPTAAPAVSGTAATPTPTPGMVPVMPKETADPTETPYDFVEVTPSAPAGASTAVPTGNQTDLPVPTDQLMGNQTVTKAPTSVPAGNQTVTTAPTKTPSVTVKPTASPTASPTATPVTKKVILYAKAELKTSKAAGKVTIVFKKNDGVDGYQVQYAKDKKFKKNRKTKTVSAKKKSVTLTGLKKKKTYYVRIRAYVKTGGKKVYGKWSTAKKIKVKK